MARIVCTERTATTITCKVVDLPDNAYYVRWYLGTSDSLMPDAGWNVAVDTATGRESPPFTFTVFDPEADVVEPLEPSTLYLVKVLLVESDNSTRIEVLQQPFMTEWEWGSWSSLGVPASEFNRLIDMIFAVNYAPRRPATTPILSDVATDYHVQPDTPMLTSQFKAVRDCLIDLGATSPPTATEDTRITSAFFNGLVSSLYSIA